MGDSILVGMRAIDMQGKISYVNPAFCRMTGFSEFELLETSSPFPYWPQSDYKELYHIFVNLIEGKTPAEGVEIRLQRKDGSIFYVRMHASPLMDGNGSQIGWLNSIIDVTDSKRAREELASAHRRFMTVVESLEVAVSVIMLEDGDFLFYNRYYSQLFGITNDAHLFLAKSPKTKRPQLTAIDWLKNIMPNLDYDYSYEEIYYAPNNKWFNIRTYPIQWVDGRIAQMMIALDITPIKNAQEQAKINEEKWHFANRVSNMGEMASSLAHELNQPLTAITNYCNGIIDRLKQENIILPSNIFNALEKTSNQAVKAGGIIKRLRSFVSKSQPKKQFEDITNIAKEAIALIGFTIQQNNIKLKLDVKTNLPHILVDRILIEQVLVNLLKNAIEANLSTVQTNQTQQKSNVTLHIYESSFESQNSDDISYNLVYNNKPTIVIDVIDEGCGIAEDVKDKIFDAFFTTKNQGMGMGLNICRSIIESHHGSLTVENNLQKGCTFRIILPLSTNIDIE
jgi:PAS domain S-box-containing protein